MAPSPEPLQGRAADGKRTYLIWDQGFARSFLASLAVIAAVGYGGSQLPSVQGFAWRLYQEVLFRLMEGAHKMAWWSAIGLLSSSCCALQLMLNAFNLGCAGFNTALGPLRPAMCALTVCMQAAVWYAARDQPLQLRTAYVAPGTLLAALLTLMPEMLSLWVQRAVAPAGAAAPKSCAHFSLGGMGCAACTKKVSEVLAAVPSVVGREISLEGKAATVYLDVKPDEARARVAPDLVRLLAAAGFEASLGRVEASGSGDNLGGAEGSPSAPCGAPPPASLGGGRADLPLSVAAGLLSSSCCLLQLGVNLLASLNVAHVGCAGFNKVLGPWRWQLRLATGGWLLASWASCLLRGWRRPAALRLLLRTLLCLLLTFLPELLLWSGGPALAPPTDGADVLQVSVEGMGCEACQVHVQGVMDRLGGVVGSRVDFSSGKGELTVQKGWAFDFAELSRKLEEDGYTVKVRSDL